MSNSRFNFFFLSILLFLIIILNEFTLKVLFSDDGTLEQKTKNLIRVFNLFQIIFVYLFLFVSSFNKFVKLIIIKY